MPEKEKVLKPKITEEEVQRQVKMPDLKQPSMSKEETVKLEVFRNEVLSRGCPGPFPNVNIAFSARNWNKTGAGIQWLDYPITMLNETGTVPPAWDGITFCVPCDGLYYFTVDFVKDQWSENTTNEDVYVGIHKNGSEIGHAWAGETSNTDRNTGTFHVILRLRAGDYMRTCADSDGQGRLWHIRNCNFSGHRIGN